MTFLQAIFKFSEPAKIIKNCRRRRGPGLQALTASQPRHWQCRVCVSRQGAADLTPGGPTRMVTVTQPAADGPRPIIMAASESESLPVPGSGMPGHHDARRGAESGGRAGAGPDSSYVTNNGSWQLAARVKFSELRFRSQNTRYPYTQWRHPDIMIVPDVTVGPGAGPPGPVVCFSSLLVYY